MKQHTNKALVSLALVVSMLFSLLANLPRAAAANLSAPPQETSEKSAETRASASAVADGVYRIISKSANKPIGAAQSIANGTNVATQNTYSESALEMFQLWKIKHLGNGLYSVRPLHKLSMGLHVTGTNVDIYEIGTSDTQSAIPTASLWSIESTSNGYAFKKNGSASEAMKAATTSTGTGINISVGTYSASSAQYHFTLSPVEDVVQGALFLFKPSANTYASSLSSGLPTVTVELGSAKTLSELGFVLSVSDPYNPSQTVQWSSSNSAVATVNSSTGKITPLSVGETTIRAERTIEDTQHVVSYKLMITVPNGTYQIKNKGTSRYIDVPSQTLTNGTGVRQEYYDIDTTREWTFTSLGDGTYTIRIANLSTNYYLGVSGQNIVIKTGTVTNDMKWKISPASNSAFKLIPASSTSSSLVLAGYDAENYDTANMLLLQNYVSDYFYEDEWYICSNVDIGLSTDNYTEGCSNGGRGSYMYANVFLTELLRPETAVPIDWVLHYNKDSNQTASISDFSVNGAISNDTDFMIYIGHGHAAHDSKGNHIHYDCGVLDTPHTSGYSVCPSSVNVYTKDLRFGSSNSDLRWVWMYTCNFLTTGQYVTEYSLKQMMNGAHIVMGYSSQTFLCPEKTSTFAEYLRSGTSIITAFFRAGQEGEAVQTNDHHIQKVLYIPQAQTETIYSIPCNYEYSVSDVQIKTNDIQDPYH